MYGPGSALCFIAYTQNQYRYYSYKNKALSYTINYSKSKRQLRYSLGSASFSQEKQGEKHRFERGEHERSYAIQKKSVRAVVSKEKNYNKETGRERRSGAYKVFGLKFLFFHANAACAVSPRCFYGTFCP